MKKLLLLLLTLSVGFNFYLIDVEYVVQDDFNNDSDEIIEMNNVVDEVKLAQSSVSKSKDSCACDKTIKLDLKKELGITNSVKEKDTFDEFAAQEKLQSLHKEWLEKSDDFFVDDLRLSQEQIMKYHELSVLRQKDMDDYFTAKMEDKISGETTYMYDSEDTIFMGKLTEKYNDLLKGNFGGEAYSRYQAFVLKHNQSDTEFIYTIQF
jgi:hypothetical protein